MILKISRNWLGLSSSESKIAESGLRLVQGLWKTALSSEELDWISCLLKTKLVK